MAGNFTLTLAALDVGSIRGGFFFVLAVAALTRIKGAAAIGTDAVVAHGVFSRLLTKSTGICTASVVFCQNASPPDIPPSPHSIAERDGGGAGWFTPPPQPTGSFC